MKIRFLWLPLLAFAAGANGQVVINEFSNDDLSGDTLEFVELYNAGAAQVDIGGWKVSRGGATVGNTYTAPASTLLPAGGFWLLGTPASLNLHSGAPSVAVDAANALSNLGNAEAFIAIYDQSNNVVDSVVYGRSATNTVNILAGIGEPAHTGTNDGGGIWAYNMTGEKDNTNASGFDNDGSPNSSLTFQRSPLAAFRDTNNNERDFLLSIATPKSANFSFGSVTASQIASGLTFDFSAADGTAETNLPGQFSSVTCHDVTVADASLPPTAGAQFSANPNSIPAAPAPGGGNAGLCWAATNSSDSGFGNCAILNLQEPITDIEAESLVYIGAPLGAVSGQYEIGSFLVLRGRPDSFYFYRSETNTAAGKYGNADVGVRIRFENNIDTANSDASTGKVKLYVDQKIDGVVTAYGSPVEIPSANWYRILLSVKGDKVAAIIGGTYGSNTADGTLAGGIRVDGTTTISRPGGVGMNYHTTTYATANLPANMPNIRPLTYDHLTFRAPALAAVEDWKLY